MRQHRSIIYQIRSEILWWSGRDGLAPFSIASVASAQNMLENGGCPVRTCLE